MIDCNQLRMYIISRCFCLISPIVGPRPAKKVLPSIFPSAIDQMKPHKTTLIDINYLGYAKAGIQLEDHQRRFKNALTWFLVTIVGMWLVGVALFLKNTGKIKPIKLF